jgi:threonine dehydrogenase-like Zn-dependent dehydrogenase
MRALTYQGTRDVRVVDVPEPRLAAEDDAIVRVTSTAICGSDLHIYRGKIPQMQAGDVLGHEFMGIVEEVGPGVGALRPGDRVVVPFVIACGGCFFCARAQFACCEETNPQHGLLAGRGAIVNKKGMRSGAALFGYSHLYGGVPGGQAERVRVPRANVGPFRVPAHLEDDEVLLLSDVLPTAFMAARNAEIGEGSSVAIYGAGPVGLLSAACARMLGARVIYIVDHHPDRLEFAAASYGALPLNFDEVDDPAEEIVRRTDRRGVDAVIDAVGFEAKGSLPDTLMAGLRIEGSAGTALRQAIGAVRRGGIVSVPGVYAGWIHAFLFGDAFEKGITFRMGQTHVQALLPELLERIANGALHPAQIVSHHLPLAEAARGYQLFNDKEENCRKVVLVA